MTTPSGVPSSSSEHQQERAGVEIRLSGIPDDAEIFYDGFKVMENPFRVKRGKTIVQLRIIQEGFRPYKVSIIPSSDLDLDVKLKPLEKRETVPQPAQPSARVQDEFQAPQIEQQVVKEKKNTTKRKTIGKESDGRKRSGRVKDFSRAGRGAVIAEDFE